MYFQQLLAVDEKRNSIEIQTIEGQRISLILECSVDYLNLSLSTIGWLVRELVAASTLLPWPFTGRNAQSSLNWNNNFTYYLRRHAKITPSNKLKKHALDKFACYQLLEKTIHKLFKFRCGNL